MIALAALVVWAGASTLWFLAEPDRDLPTILDVSPAELEAAREGVRPITGREVAGTDSGRLCVLGPYGEAAVDRDLRSALAEVGHPRIPEDEVLVAHWEPRRLRVSSFQRGRLEYGNSTAAPPPGAVLADACTDTVRALLYVTEAGLFFAETSP